MQTDYNTYESLRAILEKETPILTAQIRALYRELDKKFHLQGAKVPITFGFDTDSLGSYNQKGHGQKEHFHFSLFFIGYAVNNPLSKEDRMDLYKHEYAHYMRYNMSIPKQYQWQPGIHGSAWKYCCSLVGADVAFPNVTDLGIGTENMFISPRLFFQDGRVPRSIF